MNLPFHSVIASPAVFVNEHIGIQLFICLPSLPQIVSSFWVKERILFLLPVSS